MDAVADVGFVIFLAGTAIGLILMRARHEREVDEPTVMTQREQRTRKVGDTVILAVAAMAFFAGFLGLIAFARDISG